MITWTSKGALAAIALPFLAACEDGQGGPLLKAAGSATVKPVALSQAKMAFGAVTLVPPTGYCIDKHSLKQNFALMAPCERLGAPSASAGAPVSIITASFSSASSGPAPTPRDTATALQLDAVSDAIEKPSGVTFRANGTAPTTGLATTHWRGTTRVGTQMMGLALYGPDNGRAVGAEGRAILSKLIGAMNTGS